MRMCVPLVSLINDESDVIKIGFFGEGDAALLLLLLLLDLVDVFLLFFCLSLDQERIPLCDSSSSTKIEQIRHPIKPRTMAQAQLPPEEESTLDFSSDADVTLVAQCKTKTAD